MCTWFWWVSLSSSLTCQRRWWDEVKFEWVLTWQVSFLSRLKSNHTDRQIPYREEGQACLSPQVAYVISLQLKEDPSRVFVWAQDSFLWKIEERDESWCSSHVSPLRFSIDFQSDCIILCFSCSGNFKHWWGEKIFEEIWVSCELQKPSLPIHVISFSSILSPVYTCDSIIKHEGSVRKGGLIFSLSLLLPTHFLDGCLSFLYDLCVILWLGKRVEGESFLLRVFTCH